jgi:uroporphyrinogen-III synthase
VLDVPDVPDVHGGSAARRCSGPVVVTRPEREAAIWVQALAQHGFDALALPLMAFGPPADEAALQQARRTVADVDALMFVSPQAVQAFFEAEFKKNNPLSHDLNRFDAPLNDISPAIDWSADTRLRCWAPGPGTARALVQQGVPAECIDQPPADAAQFDSEALWPVVQGQLRPGVRVLVVRGDQAQAPASGLRTAQGSGRDWLARQCEAAGAQVQFCAAYCRQAPQWSAAQHAQAQSAVARQGVWLFSSSESLGHLAQLMPDQKWRGACALATHPRIAAAAAGLGFGDVLQTRPALADVLSQLHTLYNPLPLSPAPLHRVDNPLTTRLG